MSSIIRKKKWKASVNVDASLHTMHFHMYEANQASTNYQVPGDMIWKNCWNLEMQKRPVSSSWLL